MRAQPKRAAGFKPTRQFTRTHPYKRNRHHISTDQHVEMSNWQGLSSAKTRVDSDRVNWRGIIYLQQECGVFDPRPRLVKREA